MADSLPADTKKKYVICNIHEKAELAEDGQCSKCVRGRMVCPNPMHGDVPMLNGGCSLWHMPTPEQKQRWKEIDDADRAAEIEKVK